MKKTLKFGKDIDAAYNLLMASGRYVLDEPVYKRAMAEYYKQFGKDHKKALRNKYNTGYRAGLKKDKEVELWEIIKRRMRECFDRP